MPVIVCANNAAISGEAKAGTTITLYKGATKLTTTETIVVNSSGFWETPFSSISGGLAVGDAVTATLTENGAESAPSAPKTVITDYDCAITNSGGGVVAAVDPNVDFIFTTAAPVDAATVSYQWSILPVDANPVDAVFKGGSNTAQSATIETGCYPFVLELSVNFDGCISFCNIEIGINTVAAPVISSPICAGSSSVSGTSGANEPIKLYRLTETGEDLLGETTANAGGQWTIPITGIELSDGDMIVAKAGVCSSGVSTTVTILPHSTSDNITISGTTTICSGQATTLAASAPAVVNPVFRWYTTATGGEAFHSNAIFTTPALTSAATYYVSVSGDDYCEGAGDDARKAVTVGIFPPPSFESSNAKACIGAPQTYTTQASMSAYQWTISGEDGIDYIKIGGGTSNHSVTITWLTTGSKTISVNYTNAAGCAPTIPTTTTTVAYPLPEPTITDIFSACIREEKTYSTEAGMSNYVWEITGTESIDYTKTGGGTDDNFVKITWLTSGSQVIFVNYTDENGCTALDPALTMTDIFDFNEPTLTANPSGTLCTDIPVTYTTQAGMSGYVWTIPGIAGQDYTITGGGSSDNQAVVTWKTGGSKTVQVSYSDFIGCTTGIPAYATTDVIERPMPSLTATPAGAACLYNTVTYSTHSGMSSYVWTVGGTENVDYTKTGGGSSDNTITIKW
ncbi:hypothetical protein LJB78_01515, partial [Bacteroidales bacterium OttesenSCG-928-J16]|nr:hypothetical protein [Bacteroidales bacterium OttesenSCG-928-J16]